MCVTGWVLDLEWEPKRQIFKIGKFASALTDDECTPICRKQLPFNTAVEVQSCVIMHTLDQQKLNS